MADNCNSGSENMMNMVPFVVYGYPMCGMYPGNMMQNQWGGSSFPGCGNYLNPVYFTPYNQRHGCCTPPDLDK